MVRRYNQSSIHVTSARLIRTHDTHVGGLLLRSGDDSTDTAIAPRETRGHFVLNANASYTRRRVQRLVTLFVDSDPVYIISQAPSGQCTFEEYDLEKANSKSG